MSDTTHILSRINSGDPQAAEELLPLVYDELRNLAAARMANERTDHTLQATALVHEAYVRLVDVDTANNWDSRGHFFAAAAEAMRRILINKAIRKSRLKHGGDRKHVALDNHALEDSPEAELLSLNEALDELAQVDPQSAEIVKLKYFAGCTVPEIAEMLGTSARSIDRRWAYARAWLHQELAR